MQLFRENQGQKFLEDLSKFSTASRWRRARQCRLGTTWQAKGLARWDQPVHGFKNTADGKISLWFLCMFPFPSSFSFNSVIRDNFLSRTMLPTSKKVFLLLHNQKNFYLDFKAALTFVKLLSAVIAKSGHQGTLRVPLSGRTSSICPRNYVAPGRLLAAGSEVISPQQ